jgi:hypothetical protein
MRISDSGGNAMAKQFLVMMLLLCATAGCSTLSSRQVDNNPPFAAHRFLYENLEIDWQSEQIKGGIRIAGTVRNLRKYYLQDLQLFVRLMDEQGKVIARKSYAGFPDYLPPGKDEPFQLEFRLPPGARAELIHFGYFFLLTQGDEDYRVYEGTPVSGKFASPL